jgi:trehalose synthase
VSDSTRLERYAEIVGADVIEELQILAEHTRGRVFQSVSSRLSGGHVSEILTRILPLLSSFGVPNRWETMPVQEELIGVVKALRDALQGRQTGITQQMLEAFWEHSNRAISELDLSGDIVFVHDPQPLAAVNRRIGNSSQSWIWRCHLDISSPDPFVWEFLKPHIERYDCAVFSMPDFAQQLSIPQYMIAPSLDPLSDKNRDLDQSYVLSVLHQYEIDHRRPVLMQISRFDRLKDPLGVIACYRMVKKRFNVQLVIAGGSSADDPEAGDILDEVREYAANDPDIHVIPLPPRSDLVINALVRGSTVVLQKSIREGFGLTVSEALWKRKPVVGSAVGGIKLQIVDEVTGFLVHSPEGAANRIVQLLADRNLCEAMGENGHNLIKQNFLITRHVKDYLLLMLATKHPKEDIVYLGSPQEPVNPESAVSFTGETA